MALRLGVVPLGRVEASLVRSLAEALAAAGFEASVRDSRALPPEAFDARRGQWRAEPLLAFLAREPGPRVLGVTEHDLYAAGLNFVFGIAESPGRAALVSLARLRPGADAVLLLERARKEALHELGHGLGLRHCEDPRCVMHFSNCLADTDRKQAVPCRRCSEALADAGLRRFPLEKKVRLVGVRIAGLEHVESLASEAGAPARLLVTARGFRAARDAARALREAVPEARIRGAGFSGILLAEASGDALALAERAARAAGGRVGRVMAVLAEVESARGPVEESAVALGRAHIGPGERFCFRLHKRGAHGFVEPSSALEREIGGAIWTALRDRDGRDPQVDLASPDVTLAAEVLGPRTAMCLRRRAWRAADAPA